MSRPVKYKTEQERVAARRLAGRLRNQRYRLRQPPVASRPLATEIELGDDDIIFETDPVKIAEASKPRKPSVTAASIEGLIDQDDIIFDPA